MSDFNKLEDRILRLESNMNNIISLLTEIIKDNADNFGNIDENFSAINTKIDALHKDTNKEFGIVKSELKKINAVTSYSDQIKNLKIVD